MTLQPTPTMDNSHGAAAAASSRRTSDHFLNLFSSQIPSAAAASGAEDLDEDDIFFSATDSTPPPPASLPHKSQFSQLPGVLAALPNSDNPTPLLHRKSSLSAAKPIPAIPRPPVEQREAAVVSQSAPVRKFQHSAPVSVPMMMKKSGNSSRVSVVDEDDDDECDGEERLPPHEIVARRYGGGGTSSFSVLEGVGRTLKGRDLRQVRNAVWRQTGFLD